MTEENLESAGAVERTVDGSTDTVEDAASEEDRLRAEAAKRLERRRRKMMSPEERLARITGRPVSQVSPTLESPPPLSDSLASPDNLSVATNTLPADDPGDPPLESLRRDVTRGSVTSLGGPEADLLSGLLGTGADSPLAGLMGAQSPGGPTESQTAAAAAGTNNTDLVWVLLAVAVRLVLDTEYSGIIGDNMLAPFLLTLASLYTLGYVTTQGSTMSSLLSAALMLCGVQARLVGQLTRTLSLGQLLVHTFSLYLFTFFISHIMIVTVIDKVI